MSAPIQLIVPAEFQRSLWSGGETTQLMIFPQGSSYQDRNFTWRISIATTELDETTFTPLPDYQRIISVLEGNLSLEFQDSPLVHQGTAPKGPCQASTISLQSGACTAALSQSQPCRKSPVSASASTQLHFGDILVFDGATPTVSRGRCRDFNVMMRKSSCSGFMDSMFLSKSQQIFLPLSEAVPSSSILGEAPEQTSLSSALPLHCNNRFTAIYCSQGEFSLRTEDKTLSLPENHLAVLSQAVTLQGAAPDSSHAFVIHLVEKYPKEFEV